MEGRAVNVDGCLAHIEHSGGSSRPTEDVRAVWAVPTGHSFQPRLRQSVLCGTGDDRHSHAHLSSSIVALERMELRTVIQFKETSMVLESPFTAMNAARSVGAAAPARCPATDTSERSKARSASCSKRRCTEKPGTPNCRLLGALHEPNVLLRSSVTSVPLQTL